MSTKRLLVIAALVCTACSRDKPSPITSDSPGPVAPRVEVIIDPDTKSARPKNGKSGEAVKMVAMDLTEHGIHGIIQVPEGTKVRTYYMHVYLEKDNTFHLHIAPSDKRYPFDETRRRQRIGRKPADIFVDEPDSFFAQNFFSAGPPFTLATHVQLGDKLYDLRGQYEEGPHGDRAFAGNRFDYELMLASARSLKQSEALAKALAKSHEAAEKLKKCEGIAVEATFTETGVRITVEGEKVTDADLAPFRDLVTAETITLRAPKVSTAGMAHVAAARNVHGLYLKGENITDAAMEGVAKMTTLQRLELAGTSVTDVGLTHIEALKELRSISFGYEAADGRKAKVAGKGLAAVAGMTEMQNIHLAGVPIGDDALGAFSNLPKLSWLNLSETTVTDAGLVHLANLKSLERLFLSGCKIDGGGLGHLKSLPKLNDLYMSCTALTDAGLANLRGARIRELQCDGTPLTDAGAAHLAGLPNLSQLHLGNTALTDAALVHLKGLENLWILKLQGTRIEGTGFAHLRGRDRLADLDLSKSKLTDAGLALVAKLPGLKTLEMDDTGVTDAGLKSLHNTNLGVISLYRAKVTAAGVKALATARPNARIQSDR